VSSAVSPPTPEKKKRKKKSFSPATFSLNAVLQQKMRESYGYDAVEAVH